MEKELDLTLTLGLPSPTVETHLRLNTPTTHQGNNVDGNRTDNNSNNNDIENHGRRYVLRNEINNEEGGRKHVNVNIRYYNLIFNQFAGVGETLNVAPLPMQPSPAPAPATPTGSDYVLIDVPPKRARRNSLAFTDSNANPGQRWGCSGCCLAGRINETRKCTNLNCNAISTPMWRKGPLGPKSLCNACGIKFRKEKGKSSNGTE